MTNTMTPEALNNAALSLGAEGFVLVLSSASLAQYTLHARGGVRLCSVSLYASGRACVVDHTTDERHEEPSWSAGMRRVGVAA